MNNIDSIITNNKSNKTDIYYCPNCEYQTRLRVGRHWHNCYNPPFQMYPGTKQDHDKLVNSVNRLFDNFKP